MPPTDPGLDERVCRKLGWALETRVAWDGVRDWPPVSSSWEWAGKALDALKQHDMWACVSGPHGTIWGAAVYKHSSSLCYKCATAETGPMAIARVIDAALPEPKL